MGTNYYWRSTQGQLFHIGKSSAGWQFAFHGYKEEKINSFQDWIDKLKHGEIIDEYGKEILFLQFMFLIMSKQLGKSHAREHPSQYDRVDEDGYSFTFWEFS